MSGGGSKKQTVGYKYYLGVHMGLCHGPIDFITEIQVDKRVAWTGSASGGSIVVNAPTLFGGEKREGGVSGTIDIEMGYPEQLPNNYLQSQLGVVPAFRGVAALVFNQTYMGNNPYLKPWKFLSARLLVTSDGEEQWNIALVKISPRDDTDSAEYLNNFDFSNLLGSQPLSQSQLEAKLPYELSLAGTLGSGVFSYVQTTNAPYSEAYGDNRNYVLRVNQNGVTTFTREAGGAAVTDAEVSAVFSAYDDNDAGFTSIMFMQIRNSLYAQGTRPNNTTYDTTATVICRVYLRTNGLQQARWQIDCYTTTIFSDWFPFDEQNDDPQRKWKIAHVKVSTTNPTGGSAATFIGDVYACVRHYVGGELRTDSFSFYDVLTPPGYDDPDDTYVVDPFVEFDPPIAMFVDGDIELAHFGKNPVWFRDSNNIPIPCDMFGVYEKLDPDPGACADMNPAHIIRECLTDSFWGMGYSDSEIDDDAFGSAAQALYNESMGISIVWEKEQPIEEFIGEILRHIDGVLYVSRVSGKFVLKLIREEAPTITLDETNVASVTNARRPTISELTNTVSVTYWEATTDEASNLTAHNEALRLVQGNEISTTIQYPGFTNKSIAARVAERDLKALSTPLLSCEIVANRDAAGLNVGDPFMLDWPDLGINETVMRVDEIDYGDGVDNSIKIAAVQDVFSTPALASVADTDEEWVDPTAASPQSAVARVVTETPYYPLVLALGETQVNDVLADDPDAGYLLAAGGRQGNELNANIQVDTGSGYVNSATVDFHPYAYLAGPIGYTDTVLDIESGKDLDLVETGTIAQIGSEIVRVDSIDQDSNGDYVSVTVGRGILDTVPQVHNDGEELAFWGDYATSDNEQYVSGELADVKLQTTQSGELLDLDNAEIDRVVFKSRAIRPYPPGNLKIDGLSYPDSYIWTASHTLTWAHRDRLQQTDGNLYDYTEGNIGPESDVTYTVEGVAVYRDIFGGGSALRIGGEYQWAKGDIALDIGADDFVIEFDIYFDTKIQDENKWVIIGQHDLVEDFSNTDFSWRIAYMGNSDPPYSFFRFDHSISGSGITTAKLYPNDLQLPSGEFINVRFVAKLNSGTEKRDVRLYINGKLQDSIAAMAADFYTTNEPVRIGNYGDSAYQSWENTQTGALNDDPWRGYFRNLRITVGTPRFAGTTFPESYSDLPPFLGECDSTGLNCDEYYDAVVVLNTFDGDVDSDEINSGNWSLEGALIATVPEASGPERTDKFLDVDVGTDTEYVFDIDSGTFDSNYSEPPEGTTAIILGVKSRRDGYDSWQYPQVRLQYPGFTDSTGDSVVAIDSVGTPFDSAGDSVGDSVGSDPHFNNVSLLLHFDGADGSTTITDDSSNGYSASVVDQAQIDTADSRFGGSSLYLSAATDHIAYANNTGQICDFTASQWTLECFINPDNLTGDATIFCTRNDIGASEGIFAYILANGTLGVALFNGTSNVGSTTSSSGQVSTGVWSHVAFVRDGSSIKQFHDGVEVGSGTITSPPITPAFPFRIGRSGSSASSYRQFVGHIDEVRTTKGIARYTSNFTPPTAPFPNN